MLTVSNHTMKLYFLLLTLVPGLSVVRSAGIRENPPRPSIEVIKVTIAAPGHIYPDNMGTLPWTGTAQSIALDYINQIYAGIFNFTVEYIYDRALKTCQEEAENAALLAARWYYRQVPDSVTLPVFVMSGCTDAETLAVNRLAAPENILLISFDNADPVIRNKALSPTFVSFAHYCGSCYGDFYRHVVQKYRWTSVMVVIDDASVQVYTSLANSVIQAILAIPGQECNVRHIRQPLEFRTVLQEFRSISRVLMFCGRAERLRLLLVYLTFENFAFKLLYGTLEWNYGDKDDEIVRHAFESVLVFRPVNYKKFPSTKQLYPEELIRRAKLDYNFTLPLTPTDGPPSTLVDPFVAMTIFAQVLNETYHRAGLAAVRNSAQLAKEFFGRTFATDFLPIHIDSTGMRRDNLDMSLFNRETNTWQPVLHLVTESGQVTTLQQVDTFASGKPWPPPNEPRCGYTGTSMRCQVSTTAGNISILVPLLLVIGLTSIVLLYAFWRITVLREQSRTEEWWRIMPDRERELNLTTAIFRSKTLTVSFPTAVFNSELAFCIHD